MTDSNQNAPIDLMDNHNFNTISKKFERIRSNKAFELFVVGVIIFSALVVGVKTYQISPQWRLLLEILDWAITGIFLIELIIRFLGETNKRHFFHNAWNLFDSLIVFMSLVPVEDGDMAIIGRLIRIFRVLRMVSIIPELRVLLNALIKVMPRLGYVALLMFIIFYIFAAIGSTFFQEINPQLWGDISISLLTLFRVMTFEDWTDVMYETMTVYPLSWIYYLIFIFLTAFAFLNMVIGIVVSALEEEHQAIRDETHDDKLNANLQAQLDEIKELLKQSSQGTQTTLTNQNLK